MSNEEQIKKEFEQLINRHRKLINFLCLRASYGREAFHQEFMQECYLMLLDQMGTLKSGKSELYERAWVYWKCRDAISRYRYREKRFPQTMPDNLLVDVLEAPREATQLTVEDLASCLDGTERRCFLLMAAGATDDQLEKELGLRHSSVLQMRHTIKKKLKQYIKDEDNRKQQ